MLLTYGARGPSVRDCWPLLRSPRSQRVACGPLGRHQRARIASFVPLSPTAHFSHAACTLSRRAAPPTPLPSTLSPPNLLPSLTSARTPLSQVIGAREASARRMVTIFGAIGSWAPRHARQGAARPMPTPLTRTQAILAHLSCMPYATRPSLGSGARLERLGSTPGVARRYLPAPCRYLERPRRRDRRHQGLIGRIPACRAAAFRCILVCRRSTVSCSYLRVPPRLGLICGAFDAFLACCARWVRVPWSCASLLCVECRPTVICLHGRGASDVVT